MRKSMSTFHHQKKRNRKRRLKSRWFLIWISTYIDFYRFSIRKFWTDMVRGQSGPWIWEHRPVGCGTWTNSTDDPCFECSIGLLVSCLVIWSLDDPFSFLVSSTRRPADSPGIEIISHSWFSSSSLTIRDKMIWAYLISKSVIETNRKLLVTNRK